jgi:hypothetical protein
VTERLADRPIPLQLTIAEAHLAASSLARMAGELEAIGQGETILAAATRSISGRLMHQIGASMALVGMDASETEAAFEDVRNLADALGDPDD